MARLVDRSVAFAFRGAAAQYFTFSSLFPPSVLRKLAQAIFKCASVPIVTRVRFFQLVFFDILFCC